MLAIKDRKEPPMTTLSLTRPIFEFDLTPVLRTLGKIFGAFATAQSAAHDFQRLGTRPDAARTVFERYYA
jgi:hypothetical protein